MTELKELAKDISVLFVEDDMVTNKVTSGMLKQYFKEVYPVFSGENGVEIFKQFRPELVVADISLPSMSGMEMIRQIKQIEPDAFTMITTVYSDTDFLIESIELGVDRYLLKPISQDSFKKTFYEICKQINDSKLAKKYTQSLDEANRSLMGQIHELSDYLENAGDAIWISNQEGYYIFANQTACSLTGHSLEELKKMKILELVAEEELSRLPQHMEKLSDTNSFISDEWLLRKKDGGVIPVELMTQRMPSGRYMVIGHDISVRKHAENALKESEEKLRGLFELSPLGIALTDMDGRYIEFNKAFEDICGYSHEELNKLDYWTLTPEKYKEQEQLQLEYIAKNGRYGPYEKEYCQKNGNLIPIRLNGMLMIGKDGKQYIWSIVEDITLQIKAKKNIEYLNKTLELRVKAEVAKNREKDMMLVKQSRMAAMGEMLSNIAHQWRQPLNVLGLMIQDTIATFHEGEMDEAYLQRLIDGGMKQILYLSKTIDDFRDFFRPDKDKVPFDVKQACRFACELLEESLRHNGITLTLTIDEQECFVVGYHNEFSQAVLNILSNAKDVLLTNKPINPTIEVAIKKETETVKLTICDNGGGIKEDILEKIFEPYFTTKFKSQGTGLGLYMSKMIIEQNMSGILKVYNKGLGACFEIDMHME